VPPRKLSTLFYDVKTDTEAVAQPAETRQRLIRRLEMLREKKEDRPRKKHDVMPV